MSKGIISGIVMVILAMALSFYFYKTLKDLPIPRLDACSRQCHPYKVLNKGLTLADCICGHELEER